MDASKAIDRAFDATRNAAVTAALSHIVHDTARNNAFADFAAGVVSILWRSRESIEAGHDGAAGGIARTLIETWTPHVEGFGDALADSYSGFLTALEAALGQELTQIEAAGLDGALLLYRASVVRLEVGLKSYSRVADAYLEDFGAKRIVFTLPGLLWTVWHNAKRAIKVIFEWLGELADYVSGAMRAVRELYFKQLGVSAVIAASAAVLAGLWVLRRGK